MIEYIENIIAEFPEDITLAADNLLDVRDASEAKLLPKEQTMAFHHATAHLNKSIIERKRLCPEE
jgi:hypothetical protein